MIGQTGCNVAAFRVEQYLQTDSEFKPLSDLLKASSSHPTLSGLQDIDYPNILGLNRKLPLISNITTIPLPVELVEQFSNMQQSCELGLFPEISRAWITVDSNIFVWAYDNASDVAYYDGLDQAIISVCLINPKPGVFKPHIKYLLCLATALEVTLLGVTFSDQEPNTLATVLLIPDPVFKIATDNVILSVVAGTADGRIFLGGEDGCLYEIAYQAEEGWFSRKCRKINHSSSIFDYVMPSFLNFNESEPIAQIEIDNTRHFLYTRSSNNTIQLFDLGSDGMGMRCVAQKTWSSVVNQAANIARTIDSGHFKLVVSMKVIDNNESDKVCLVTITQSGVRLYFSASGERPSSLDLVHVRLPPGFTPSSAMQKPNSVNNLYYRNNTYIMTSSQAEDKDLLWTINNDAYVFESQMMEAFNVNSLGGKVWKISEESKPNIVKNNEKRGLPLLLTQQFEERRKFVLLTSQGVHIFYKYRPIDQLSRLLTENQGPEAAAVRSYFQTTKPTEACLTCLILACTNKLPQDIHLVEWSTLAFLRYGGEPKLVKSKSGTNSSPIMSTPLGSPSHTMNLNASPIATYYNNLNNFGLDQMEIQFSAKHDAIYLYVARILRPIWSLKVAAIKTVAPKRDCLINTATSEMVLVILKRLIELKQFLASNSQLTIENNRPNQIHARIEPIDPMSYERESLLAISKLINRYIEVLNLYQLLHEHEFSVVCANIPAEQQAKFTNTTFKDLTVVGGDLTTMLASALVRRYLDDNITTDAISRKLHELCPSIFREENALHAKAHEMVLQARGIIDQNDRDRVMNEALNLFKKIGARLDLQAVCDLLHSAKAYKHIVDICLYIADRRDPQNLASHYHRQMNETTIDDGEKRNKAAVALQERMECYTKVIETLERLLNSINCSLPSPMNISNSDELQVQQNHKRSKDDAIISFDQVVNTAVKSNDELFHFKLYEWLCNHDLSAKLLDIQSPFLEIFLKQKSSSERSFTYLDMMWRYYERRGQRPKAAQVLSALASKSTSEYDLHRRLEYLSRAIICMQSSGTAVITTENLQKITPGELLHELSEKMEVARIQLHILEKIKDLPDNPAAQDAISQLNFSLLDLGILHDNFAMKFMLYDCQLAILKCGGHYDRSLIEKLWQNIIDSVLSINARDLPEAQLLVLGNRITNLAQLLMPSDRYVPAHFIVPYVEYKTHEFHNTTWLIKVLTGIGFTPSKLLDIYHKFYKSREALTYWPGKSTHVLRVIANFIESYLDKTNGMQKNMEMSFVSTCMDVISGYLIDLQTLITSDREILKLSQDYKILQSRLNALLN